MFHYQPPVECLKFDAQLTYDLSEMGSLAAFNSHSGVHFYDSRIFIVT